MAQWFEAVSGEKNERISAILSAVPGAAEKAITAAVKRGQATARSTALKGITAHYSITPSNVRAETNINVRTRHDGGGIAGYVSFSGAAIPLYRFNVSPKTPTPRQEQHISVGVEKGKVTRFKHAFVAKMRSGHYGVFERVAGAYMKGRSHTKHGEAIGYDGAKVSDQFYGPSTSQMVSRAAIVEEVEIKTRETIDKRVEHEISRILSGNA